MHLCCCAYSTPTPPTANVSSRTHSLAVNLAWNNKRILQLDCVTFRFLFVTPPAMPPALLFNRHRAKLSRFHHGVLPQCLTSFRPGYAHQAHSSPRRNCPDIFDDAVAGRTRSNDVGAGRTSSRTHFADLRCRHNDFGRHASRTRFSGTAQSSNNHSPLNKRGPIAGSK